MAKQDAGSILPRRLRANPRTVARGLRALKAERARAQAAGCDFVFSVIVPVYNTAAYLEDCVQSVIAQSVGFSDIQLILVDDGSTDDSATICERYAREHPANVTFCSQANAGVSAARNLGLAQVRGLWVNFLDSDDLWSPHSFACALAFHAAHPEVRLVALRHWFFGANTAQHALAYKFKRDRVIDLAADPQNPQLSLSNAFVEAPLLNGRAFNTALETSEDFALVNEVLMDLGAYGVCASEGYLYRKRAGGGSAIDGAASRLSFYEQTPELCYRALFESSQRRFGTVIPYIQHCVMYDLQWRLRISVPGMLSGQQMERYRQTLVWLLESISDDVILYQKRMNLDQKLYALALKYHTTVQDIVRHTMRTTEALVWQHEDTTLVLATLDELEAELVVEFLTAREGSVTIEGHCELFGAFAHPWLRVLAHAGDTCAETTLVERPDQEQTVAFAQDTYRKLGFCVDLPWDGTHTRYDLEVVVGGARLHATLTFGPYAGMEATMPHTYWDTGGVLWTMPDEHSVAVEPSSARRRVQLETALRAELLRRAPGGHRLVVWRTLGCEARRHREREDTQVWLIFDRPTKAGDNGEALFAYLCEHPQPGVEPVFALSRASEDWDRLAEMGPVVEFASVAYRKVFFRANVIASSSADALSLNAFGGRGRYLKDLYGFRYAFLQHGVTKDDQSAWLNRYNKNLGLFVASAQREYESLLEGPYGYGPDVVRLTGFPRHDGLEAAAREAAAREAEPRRVVYLMPTWRANLSVGHIDSKTGLRPANGRFEQSAYFAFYNGLIGSERLNEALAARGYELRFVLHPAFEAEASKFCPGPAARVLARCDYRAAFVEGSLLVTDYSSVAFDFALLRKPVVYAQFDKDTFFGGHTYRPGYFDYERDGFGPVCTTLDQTVEAIVAAFDAGCVMDEAYAARVDAFYGEQPVSRCAAVVDALLSWSAGDSPLDKRDSPLDKGDSPLCTGDCPQNTAASGEGRGA